MSGKRGKGIPRLTFENIQYLILLLCKKQEDPPEGMYKEVDDSGRDKRGMQKP